MDDLQDAYPNDAAKQYLPIAEAISKVADANLRSCLSNETQNFEHAGQLIETSCPQWRSVQSLEGLQNFTELEVIYGDGPGYTDLSPLALLIDLRTLQLNNPQGARFVDASPLAGLENLESLRLNQSNISDFAFLSKLQQLKYLELSNSRLSNLADLRNLSNLEELYIHNTLVRDLGDTSVFAKLRRLDVQSLQLTDIDALFVNNPSLTSLYAGNNNLTEVNLSVGLRSFEYIGLHNNRALSQIKNLASKQIQQLDVRWASLQDLTFLPEGVEINRLNVGSEGLINVDPLQGVVGLDHLTIQDAPLITDFSIISKLGALSGLELRNLAGLTDLSFLSGQGRLDQFTLESSYNINDYSQLAALVDAASIRLNYLNNLDLKPLADLDFLTNLELRSNQLNDIEDLAFLRYLEYLDISDNQIQDISVLNRVRTLRRLSINDNAIRIDRTLGRTAQS